MKILYGVCGEGMGHAMRSAVVAKHLVSRGHDVRFVSSGNAFKYLSQRFPQRVTYAVGLGTIMHRNSVMPLATVIANVAKQTLAWPGAHIVSALFVGAKPDVVISDFDPWSARYAGLRGVPLVAVDNVHFMNRFTHPSEVVSRDRTAAAIMYPAVSAMVPDAKRYLVTAFVSAAPRLEKTSLHAPILRPEILQAPVSSQSHVVVYFNDKADHRAIDRTLGSVDAKFHVYGESVSHETTRGNVTRMPFSEARFIGDLAASSAVVSGAGFTLMSEAIFLGKPMLAVPFGGQFEQILNANYLERAGFGARAIAFDGPTLSEFLQRTPSYMEELSKYKHDHNAELLRSVEDAISLGGTA